MNKETAKTEKGQIRRIRRQLLSWYHKNHRKLPWRETDDPYSIWVSEAMLQQTQVKTALPYYRAFIKRFPDIETLAKARQQTVLKAWEGLGYYARCRNLHKAAKVVRDMYGGQVPDNPDTFRKLPGVGEYIAAAVQSIAYRHCLAVVDGNVKRVLARLYEIEAPANDSGSLKVYKPIAQALLDTNDPGTFNQALMELGATVCTPKSPGCPNCPVASFCQSKIHQTTDRYPKRVKSRPIPEYRLTAGIVFKGDKVLITRRPSNGLLGGLWEFPGGEIRDNENPEITCGREMRKSVNLDVRIQRPLTRIRHAYTHFKIVMDVFLCDYCSGTVKLNGASNYRWVPVSALKKYPFTGASLKFIPLIPNA